jgi:Phage integrase family
MARRSYGTGSIYVKAGSWYGRWWVGDRRVKRKLGPVRQPGSRDGLTKAQAERELRRRMESEPLSAPTGGRLTLTEAGERLILIDYLEALGRKPTTIGVYKSLLRTHLATHFRDRPLDRVRPEDVEGLIARMRRGGAGAKTVGNALTLLGQIFDHGIRKGWCATNPVKRVDRPRVEQSQEIRFLDPAEVEALLRATTSPTDRALFLTAAMTGLRQGELLGLQWRSVDWAAGKIRISYKPFSTPAELEEVVSQDLVTLPASASRRAGTRRRRSSWPTPRISTRRTPGRWRRATWTTRRRGLVALDVLVALGQLPPRGPAAHGAGAGAQRRALPLRRRRPRARCAARSPPRPGRPRRSDST